MKLSKCCNANNAYEGFLNRFICSICGNIEYTSQKCCVAPEILYVKMITTSNSVTLREFCKNCKQTVGGIISSKKISQSEFNLLKVITPEHKKVYYNLYQTECDIVTKLSHSIKEKAYSDFIEQRQSEYNEYINSNEWKLKRLSILKRDNYICQGCLTNRATQVHHLTYKNFGNEFLFELTSICEPCHKRYHLK